MANLNCDGLDDEIALFNRLAKPEQIVPVFKSAVYAGSGVLAEEIKNKIDALPSESFRHLSAGDTMRVFSETNRRDLKESIGISKIKEGDGEVYTYVGFAGYGSPETATNTYPNGLPNALLARSIERGSSVRKKKAFVKPAAKDAVKEAEAAMQKAFESSIENLSKG